MAIECRLGRIVMTDEEVDVLLRGSPLSSSGRKVEFVQMAQHAVQVGFCNANCPEIDDGRRCCLDFTPDPNTLAGEPTPRSIMHEMIQAIFVQALDETVIDDPRHSIIL